MKIIKIPSETVYFSVEDVPADKIAALTAAIRDYRNRNLTDQHYVYRSIEQETIEIDIPVSPEDAEALAKIVESFK